MASTTNQVYVSSPPPCPPVLPPSDLHRIRTQPQERRPLMRRSIAVPSEYPGYVDVLGIECSSDEQGGIACEGSEKYNQRPADVSGRRKNRDTRQSRSETHVRVGGQLETAEIREHLESTLEFGTSERKVSHHGAKRFKRGAQQHVCNNEKMHPRSRHRGVFLDYSEFSEKYPYLKPFLRNDRFGHCNINFRDPLALYSLSKAILKEFYSLEFQLPVGEDHRYLIPCVPSRANYIHHIADQLADVDVEATAYLKGDIPGIGASPEDRNSVANIVHTNNDTKTCSSSTTKTCATVGSGPTWSSGHCSCKDFPSPGCGGTCTCETSDSSSPPSSAPVNNYNGSSNVNTNSDSAITNCSSLGSSRSGDEAVNPLRGERVTVLDIGVGANCIYPLLGSREYGWRFVGSDVSEASLAVAHRNVQMNALEGKICLRLQPRRDSYFINIVKPEEFYSLTMCNPPFHSSREQVNVCPVRTLEAQDHEILCEGGEWQFISNMIEESKLVCAQVLWFTTLVARAATVKQVKKHIWEELRCFSSWRKQQEKLMESLWRKRPSATKAADVRCGENTAEENSVTNLRREVLDDGRNQATSRARKEATSCVDKNEENGKERPPHIAEESLEEKMRLDLPEKISIEGKKECKHEGVVEEASASVRCSPEEQQATACDDFRSQFPVHICEFRVKELLQGKQTRWVICWTYWTAEQRKMVRNSIRETLL